MTTVFSARAIANWLVYPWLPLYLYERFHMSLTGAGFTATFYIQGASVGGIVLGGWVADRWGTRSPRGRIYTQAAGLLLASPFLFLLGNADTRLMLVAALVVFGIGRGFYDCNTMPVLCQLASDDLRSTGYGIFNFAGCLSEERHQTGCGVSDRGGDPVPFGSTAAADTHERAAGLTQDCFDRSQPFF